MIGICAGDARYVQLGDLVVAERTFTYDNGKFTLDDNGRRVHLHDTLTYQLDANILQFLGLFDDWKPLVAILKQPPSSPEQDKRRTIACHIKAMASGSAVRGDHPDTAQSLYNLLGLYSTQGKYEQAEPLLQRALVIIEKQLGPEHPTTATVRENYDEFVRNMKRNGQGQH